MNYPEYINRVCGHVVTGNLNIIKHNGLKDTISKGPLFKEPRSINFDDNLVSVIKNVKDFLPIWCNKENVAQDCISAWFQEFVAIVTEETDNLKNKYVNDLRRSSIFNNSNASRELKYLHEHFIFCPIDKATKNVAIICKKYYIDNILEECKNNTGINISNLNVEIINKNVTKFCKSVLNFDTDPEISSIPHMVASPKFHKPILKMRYIVSYAKCSIKLLAKYLTQGLKAIYKEIVSYCKCNMLFKVTGVKRNWIILNNNPILEGLNYINEHSIARNVETYDFSTLYTNLKHDDIKLALRETIKLAFRRKKSKIISIYKKGFSWVSKPRNDTFVFDEHMLIQAVDFVIDNCYFTIGNMVFKQTVGVPIGIDCGPYIANLTLFYYENRFLETTYKSKYIVAKKLTYTYRLIDDITTLNSDGYFKEYFKEIYPPSLELNKENIGDLQANVLDLDINILDNNKFSCKLFDKRDNFNFKIVQFQPIHNNQASAISYGVFNSQIIRFSRICSDIKHFKERVLNMFNELCRLGYKDKRLIYNYNKIVRKHDLCWKYGISYSILLISCFNITLALHQIEFCIHG